MAEPYCVELFKPVESLHGIGWFVQARRTENAKEYYLTVDGTVEPDALPGDWDQFYFKTEQDAYTVMKKYFEDWGEPFPYEDESNTSVQIIGSKTMTFI